MCAQTVLLISSCIAEVAKPRGRKQSKSEAKLFRKQQQAKVRRRTTCSTCGTYWFIRKNQYPRYRKNRKLEAECRCRWINGSRRHCLKLDVVMNYPKLKRKMKNTIVASQMHAARYKIATSYILVQRVLKLRSRKSFVVGSSSNSSGSYTRTRSAEIRGQGHGRGNRWRTKRVRTR